jgi:hypothetical protein
MLGSPRISSSLAVRLVPRPLQVAQAPKGELNEKWRGSSSGMEMPQSGQPYFSEKRCVVGAAPSCRTTSTSPSASRSAVSTLSR